MCIRDRYKAIKHALTSNKELGVIWNKKIEDCGLFFDKVLKRYTPVQKLSLIHI